MSTYDLGDLVALGVAIADSAGTAVNATTVSCVVTLPDATTYSATVANPATGSYAADYAPTQAGRHTVRWVATGANASAFSDSFTVLAGDAGFIVSLADVRDSLNLAATNTTHDEELRQYLAAATPVIEDIVGPVLTATHTSTSDGGGVVLLPHTGVTVTSVVESGSTLPTTGYVVDSAAGVVRRSTGNTYTGFAAGVANIVVTYTVGSGTVAPNVALAARELVRFWWQQGQQSSNRPTFGSQDLSEVFTPSGYAVPRRVIELLGSAANRPGMA